MPINSRDKGARFELELAARLREYGYDARRTAQHCGKSGDAADVMGLPGLHIEAKHAEQMRLYEWLEQAKRAALARRVIDDCVRRGVWEELGRGVAGQMRMEAEGIWR